MRPGPNSFNRLKLRAFSSIDAAKMREFPFGHPQTSAGPEPDVQERQAVEPFGALGSAWGPKPALASEPALSVVTQRKPNVEIGRAHV